MKSKCSQLPRSIVRRQVYNSGWRNSGPKMLGIALAVILYGVQISSTSCYQSQNFVRYNAATNLERKLRYKTRNPRDAIPTDEPLIDSRGRSRQLPGERSDELMRASLVSKIPIAIVVSRCPLPRGHTQTFRRSAGDTASVQRVSCVNLDWKNLKKPRRRAEDYRVYHLIIEDGLHI